MHPLVTTLAAAFARGTGEPPELVATTGTTDAGVLGLPGARPRCASARTPKAPTGWTNGSRFPSIVQTAQVMGIVRPGLVRAVRLIRRRRGTAAVAGRPSLRRRGSQEVGHTRTTLRGVPEIRRFFRTNESPYTS